MRALLFWGVCIPMRIYLASRGNDRYLRAAAALISYRWLSGLETAHTGVFGGPAFWADQRPIHGVLWGSYAMTGTSTFLWMDTALGAFNWLRYYSEVKFREMVLDGVRTGVNTVVFATPILGTAIALLVATTPARDVGPIARGIGGAMAGGTAAAIWEYTLNNSDRPEIKAEIIMGSAGIGAGAGFIGPMIF